MDKMMKRTFSTLFALILIAASVSNVEAQQSDYDTIQDFRAEYQQLLESVERAASTDELNEIAASIDALESDYRGYADLINAAIYPDTYSSRIATLRSWHADAVEHYRSIEELNERVDELRSEVESFQADLAEMDARAVELRREIEESQANERRLSGLVREYRENLEARDEFVTDFLEDLLKRYEVLDAATADELAEAAERLEDNPVDLVKTILGEYINFTNEATGLNAYDYLRMSTQHAYFNDVWQRIGERLTQVFDADPVQSHQEVTDLLANWNAAIDNRIWGALDSAFAQNDISLDNFTDAGTFFNSLTSYIRAQTETAIDRNSEEDLEQYRNFSRFWNQTVKGEWGEYLMNGNILTYEQMSQIDSQLEEWNEAAVPVSNLMLILFLISVAVIIGLVVALVRKK